MTKTIVCFSVFACFAPEVIWEGVSVKRSVLLDCDSRFIFVQEVRSMSTNEDTLGLLSRKKYICAETEIFNAKASCVSCDVRGTLYKMSPKFIIIYPKIPDTVKKVFAKLDLVYCSGDFHKRGRFVQFVDRSGNYIQLPLEDQ